MYRAGDSTDAESRVSDQLRNIPNVFNEGETDTEKQVETLLTAIKPILDAHQDNYGISLELSDHLGNHISSIGLFHGERSSPMYNNSPLQQSSSNQIINAASLRLQRFSTISSSVTDTDRYQLRSLFILNGSLSLIKPELYVQHLPFFLDIVTQRLDTLSDIPSRQLAVVIVEKLLMSEATLSETDLASIEKSLLKVFKKCDSLILLEAITRCLSALTSIHRPSLDSINSLILKFSNYLTSIEFTYKSKILRRKVEQRMVRISNATGRLSRHIEYDRLDYLARKMASFLSTCIGRISSPWFYDSDGLISHQGKLISDQSRKLAAALVDNLAIMLSRYPALVLKDVYLRLYYSSLIEADLVPELNCAILNNIKIFMTTEISTRIQLTSATVNWDEFKDMSRFGNENDETLPKALVCRLHRGIIKCCHSHNLELRRQATSFIKEAYFAGHLDELMFLPRLIALSTDDDQTIRSLSIAVLKSLEENHKNFSDIPLKLRQGIIEAFFINRSSVGYMLCGPSEDTETNEAVEVLESKLSGLYRLIANDPAQSKRFLNLLLDIILDPDHKIEEVLSDLPILDPCEIQEVWSEMASHDILEYVADNLSFLPYKRMTEVHYVKDKINEELPKIRGRVLDIFDGILIEGNPCGLGCNSNLALRLAQYVHAKNCFDTIVKRSSEPYTQWESIKPVKLHHGQRPERHKVAEYFDYGPFLTYKYHQLLYCEHIYQEDDKLIAASGAYKSKDAFRSEYARFLELSAQDIHMSIRDPSIPAKDNMTDSV